MRIPPITVPLPALVLVLVALLALALHVRLFPHANPTAALRLHVSRAEAGMRAQRFLVGEAVTLPGGYQRAISFVTDSDAKSYLELTLGLRQANRVMQAEGFVFGWEVRWFRPGAQREFLVTIDPDGRVTGWEEVIPDDAPAPFTANPREVTRAFALRAAGLDLDDYALKDRAMVPRAHRIDYTYTWERRDFRLGEATQRLDVTVTGDRVIAFARYLEIPEAFTHRFTREQHKGGLLAQLAFALSTVFSLAGLVAVIIGLVRRTLRWRGVVLPAALVAVIVVVNGVNLLPLQHAAFDVSDTEFAFWSNQALELVLSGVFSFFSTLFLVIAAEWLYRRAFPDHAPIARWFSRRGIASPEGRTRLHLGYGLLLLHLGYVTVFYVVVERYFGGWSPAHVPYNDLFSTAVPWAYALLVGVQAAVSEEFLFRVLAISWLLRVVRAPWLAILLPAAIWGFAHCNYPNMPFFIRGIELTVVGVVFGMVFVRFGPLPTLLSHAGFNAILVGEALLGSVEWSQRLHAAWVLLAVLLPATLAWWWARRARGEAETLPATNAELERQSCDEAAAIPPPEPLPATEPPYRPLPAWVWPLTLAALTLTLVLGWVHYRVTDATTRYEWREPKMRVLNARTLDRHEALRRARRAAEGQGARLRGWIASAVLEDEGEEDLLHDYLRGFISAEDARELILRTTTPESLWVVKWQKPLAREAWVVRLRANGALWDIRHLLPDEAPGASLPESKAREMAAAELKRLGLDLAHLRLTGAQRHAHPHRVSYLFTWELVGVKVGKAQFLTRVRVDGDRANGVSRTVSVPDSYRFARARATPGRVIPVLLGLLLAAGLLVGAAAAYLAALRRYRVPWRWGIGTAAVITVFMAVVSVLAAPVIRSYLPTTLSPAAFTVEVMASEVLAVLMPAAMLCLVLPVSVSLWHAHFPDLPGPRYWWRVLRQPWRHLPAWGDAVLIQPLMLTLGALIGLAGMLVDALAGSAASSGVSLPTWLVNTLPPPDARHTGAVNMLAPVAFAPAVAVVSLLVLLACWPFLLALGKAVFRRSPLAPAAFLLLLALPLVARVLDGQSLLPGIATLGGALAFLALYRYVLRLNPLILPMSAATALLMASVLGLLDVRAYRLPAAVLLLALGAVFVLTLLGAQYAAARQRAVERAQRIFPDIPEPPSLLPRTVVRKYQALRRYDFDMPLAAREESPEESAVGEESPEDSAARE